MATILKLKLRKRTDGIFIPNEVLRAWDTLSKKETQEQFYKLFEQLSENPSMHDKTHLERIVNWIPIQGYDRNGRPIGKGLPMKEQARWMRLAETLDEMDDGKETTINLSTKDVKLIWERLNDDQFLIESPSSAFRGFLWDFQEATHTYFDGLDPDDIDKNDEEFKELEALLIKETEGSNKRERDQVPA